MSALMGSVIIGGVNKTLTGEGYANIGGVWKPFSDSYANIGGVWKAMRGGLPAGYTELLYIESSGTQYIDTGVKPSSNLAIDIDAKFISASSADKGVYTYFGARAIAKQIYYAIMTASSNTWNLYFEYGRNVGYAEMNYETLIARRMIHVENGSATADDFSVTYAPTTELPDFPIYIFGSNDDGTASFLKAMRLYSCKMYDNGVLVRDFVPCRNASGEVGLYDTVSRQFFRNLGTGVFMAGVQKAALPTGYTQFEYIESSGTQYIDTGFKPDHNSRIVVDGQLTATSGAANTVFGVRTALKVSGFYAFWHATYSKFLAGYGTESGITVAGTSTGRHVFDLNRNIFAVDTASSAGAAETFSCDYNTFLFALNSGGSGTLHASMKLYSCRIYDNGTLVRDFVPCTDDGGRSGLYDLVNAQFYRNAGTGTFTAGD